MSNEIGVEAVRNIINSLGEIGKSVEAVLEDGKIGLSDITEVPSLISDFNAIASNWKQAKEELANLQQDEVNLIAIELINVLFSQKLIKI